MTTMYFSGANFGNDIIFIHRKLINFFSRSVLRIFDLREYRVRWVKAKSSLGANSCFNNVGTELFSFHCVCDATIEVCAFRVG